jgi:hypothetical protein
MELGFSGVDLVGRDEERTLLEGRRFVAFGGSKVILALLRAKEELVSR